MIIINIDNEIRSKNKKLDKYINKISKRIYKNLYDLNIETQINNSTFKNAINIYYDQNCIEDLNNNRSIQNKYVGAGYNYELNINKDNNLTDIRYQITDCELISNTWINLAYLITKEIADDLGYIDKRITNNIYEVQKGDSLYQIAKKFNTSIDMLKLINNLETDELMPGTNILISSSDPEEIITYVVWFDDTLESIAKKYNTSIEEIKKLNNIDKNNINIGDVLVIPIINNDEQNYIKYIVKEGDNLYRLAKKFNTTVSNLKKWNNIDTNLLKIGQELIVGKKESNIKEYTVQEEDNIYSVANKFDITIEKLKEFNNLSSNELTPNSILKIQK